MHHSVLGGERARPLTARIGLAVVSVGLLCWAPWVPPPAMAARSVDSPSLPTGFRQFDVAGFRLHTDAPADVVGMVHESLTRCEREFASWALPLGLPLRRASGPLDVVLFARHSDFLAFARDEDSIDASWMGGYYAAKSNRVVLYDDADSPEFRALLARCPDDHAGRALRGAVLTDARRATARKALHEVAHLLSFNIGLQQRDVEYPLWLTEGIAEAFVHEVLGPDHDDGRRQLPTRDLLALGCSGGLQRNDLHDLYDQSRALVSSLRVRDPARLAACLGAFREAPAGADPLSVAEAVLGPSAGWSRVGTPVVAGAESSEP